MGGHLFVTRSDLTALACDDWLVPTDRRARVGSWSEALGQEAREELDRISTLGMSERVRRLPLQQGAPAAWLVDIAGDGDVGLDYLLEGVEAFLTAVQGGTESWNSRSPRLVALPIVGTGRGGHRDAAGAVLLQLVPFLERYVSENDLDVVLVAYGREDHAAAQAARSEASWGDLSDGAREAAKSLATDAGRGRLAVFLGAGVGVGAGLPLWEGLLDAVTPAWISEDVRARARALAPEDRAQLLEVWVQSEAQSDEHGGSVSERVRSHLKRRTRPGLAHVLLAGLPVGEVITTNFDSLFEQASAAVGCVTAVLPRDPRPDRDRWLLKMHGCVDEPGSELILSRRSFLRYSQRHAALAGIVQSLLITRRVLFVGFSLNDPNFHRVVDAVRQALPDQVAPGTLGTVLALSRDEVFEELWGGDLEWVHLVDEDVPTEVDGRRLEMFLDYLSYLTASHDYLLHDRFAGVADEERQRLRAALVALQSARAEAEDPVIWSAVDVLLSRFGGTEPVGGRSA